MPRVIIFTDGASKGNPGPGGWGAIVADAGRVEEFGDRDERTTNNRMELTAALEALRHARAFDGDVYMYTDSRYVLDGATKWSKGWIARDWVTKENKPVLNRDLWEPLTRLLGSYGKKIHWHLVGGHVAIAGNERVDAIASAFAGGRDPALYAGSRSAYGIDVEDVSHDRALHEKKSRSRARARTQAYSYVSEVDGVVKVHKTWSQCEARVRGKRARFKKATSPAEERSIVARFSSR